LAAKGRRSVDVLAELYERKRGDADWRRGRTFSLVYPTGSSEVDGLLTDANLAYLFENALNPLRFPSLARMEREVTDMVASLLHAPVGAGAGFSSGGTESILLSVLVSRERAAERGVVGGNLVFPASAHPAFAKAAHLTGLEARSTDLRDDFTADPMAMASAIDERTVLVVGSAYSYPHGVVDPIGELSELARARDIPFHSDACIGGFVLPFLEELDYEVPLFDFRLPGVTQISTDVHKYGYSTKGASVIAYRDKAWLAHQTFRYDAWPSGGYRTPSLAGARAASPVAAAWAVMNHLGREGYAAIMADLMATTRTLSDGIAGLPGLVILGDPIGPLLSFASTTQDINAIGDRLDDTGWCCNRVKDPPGLHLMVSPLHGTYVEEFLSDLADAVASAGTSRGVGVRYND
jgi:glutamate/tyrosine decarboxylase-like PLP-dependent enzyme